MLLYKSSIHHTCGQLGELVMLERLQDLSSAPSDVEISAAAAAMGGVIALPTNWQACCSFL